MTAQSLLKTLLGLMLVAGVVSAAGDARHTSLTDPDLADAEERQAWDLMRLSDPVTGRIPADIRRRELEFARTLPSRRRSALFEAARVEPAAKMMGWRFRGPRNVGGRTRALAVDVSDPTGATLLAGAASGGMWRSTDDGASWILTTAPEQLHSVTTIAQDTRPGHENVWYYGTGEYAGQTANWPVDGSSGYFGDGLFKSTDGGLSWLPLAATSGTSPTDFTSSWQFVHRLAVDASNTTADEVYAAAYEAIYRSEDGGTSFQRVISSPGSRLTDVVVSPSGVVFAALDERGTRPGIHRSVDGLGFADITPPDLFDYHRIVLALAPSNENILYCLVAGAASSTDTRFYKYTYVSGDGTGAGGVWENRSALMANLPHFDSTGPLSHGDDNHMVVTVHPNDAETVYVGGQDLYRSTDGFQTPGNITWIGGYQYDEGNDASLHRYQHVLVFGPGSASIAYSGTHGGVHRTMDAMAAAVVWTPLNNGYHTSQFNGVAIDEDVPGSDVVISGMSLGAWYTNTNQPETDWVLQFGGTASAGAVADAVRDSVHLLYSYVVDGAIVRVKADPVTGEFLAITRIEPAGAGDFLWLNPFVMDPVETFKVYTGTSNGVWRNNDYTPIRDYSGGDVTLNWEHLTTEPAGDYVSALAVSRSASRILYYGTATGRVFRLDAASTAPAGATPNELAMGPDFPSGAYVANIAIHPDDDQQVLLGVSNYRVVSLFFSADGGANWESVEGNLGGTDGPSIRDVAIVPVDVLYDPPGSVQRDVYFAATSTGVYSAVELAGSETVWRLEAPDLIGNVVVTSLATRPADGTVVVGTHGRGAYSIDLRDVAAARDDGVPAATRLAQNTPNPFNPQTTIAFALPRPETVTLTVHDLAGRLVRTLAADEPLTAGRHEREWWGRDDRGRPVASGVYLYRIEAGAFSETRRMTLVK
jgi:hypothetical protein